MVSDYSLCGFGAETNSLKDLLAFLSFNDFGGDCPDHYMVVWWLVLLWPVLVAWAWGFWVGLLPLVWLAILVLATMWDTIGDGIQHGDIWTLVLGFRRVFTHCTTLWWVV